MPPKKTKTASLKITTLEGAEKALQRMEAIQAQIEPLMREATDLKRDATEFAVNNNIDVIQLDGRYYRQIQRYNRTWDTDLLRDIVKGIKVKGKPLWQLITKRVPDSQLINIAVAQGHISQKKVEKAFTEKPQAPFLQRYEGEADDG